MVADTAAACAISPPRSVRHANIAYALLAAGTAPVLIAILAQRHGVAADGSRVNHYDVPESVGIAAGFLVARLHHAGLATLTHTPSPMNCLNEICKRPDSEKPYILLVVGYPAAGCMVPAAGGIKKPLDAIASWI